MNHVLLAIILIAIPFILIISAIQVWDIRTKKMTQSQKDDLLAKVAIMGTIITTTAIAYMIIFNMTKSVN